MSVQDKFNRANVIYKITKDIDLGGETLTIPEGCTLDFQGGSISNGTLMLNNTSVPTNIVIEDYVLAKIEGTYKAGQCLYSIEKKKIICWDGEKWTDANGHEIMDSVGDSGSRPDFQFETNVGFQFYDTTLNKPIWWNGLAWADSNGDEV